MQIGMILSYGYGKSDNRRSWLPLTMLELPEKSRHTCVPLSFVIFLNSLKVGVSSRHFNTFVQHLRSTHCSNISRHQPRTSSSSLHRSNRPSKGQLDPHLLHHPLASARWISLNQSRCQRFRLIGHLTSAWTCRLPVPNCPLANFL